MKKTHFILLLGTFLANMPYAMDFSEPTLHQSNVHLTDQNIHSSVQMDTNFFEFFHSLKQEEMHKYMIDCYTGKNKIPNFGLTKILIESNTLEEASEKIKAYKESPEWDKLLKRHDVANVYREMDGIQKGIESTISLREAFKKHQPLTTRPYDGKPKVWV